MDIWRTVTENKGRSVQLTGKQVNRRINCLRHTAKQNRMNRSTEVGNSVICEMKGRTLNNAESKQVTVLQSQEVTHLGQKFLAQSLHLRRREEEEAHV